MFEMSLIADVGVTEYRASTAVGRTWLEHAQRLAMNSAYSTTRSWRAWRDGRRKMQPDLPRSKSTIEQFVWVLWCDILRQIMCACLYHFTGDIEGKTIQNMLPSSLASLGKFRFCFGNLFITTKSNSVSYHMDNEQYVAKYRRRKLPLLE